MFNSKTKKIFFIVIISCIFTLYSLDSSVFAQDSKEASSNTKAEETEVSKVQKDSTTESQQSIQDNKFLLHLDIGPVFNVKISSDSLSSTKTAGLSLFMKYKNLDNLYQGLELLFHSRYSGLASEFKEDNAFYEAKISHLFVGSSIKFKIKDNLYVLGGLDLGLAYAKKYIVRPDYDTKSLYKVAVGMITNLDYTCYFNPYLHTGFKFNINLGSISNIQTLIYVGLSF